MILMLMFAVIRIMLLPCHAISHTIDYAAAFAAISPFSMAATPCLLFRAREASADY